MEVTVIRVCATMHAGSTATGPSRASFAWNGRMGAGKILYESQRMKKPQQKGCRRISTGLVSTENKGVSPCAAEQGVNAWKKEGEEIKPDLLVH